MPEDISSLTLADRYLAVHITVALNRLYLLSSVLPVSIQEARSDSVSAGLMKLAASELSDLRLRSVDYAKWLQSKLAESPSAFESTFNTLIQDDALVSPTLSQQIQRSVSAKGGLCAYLDQCLTSIIDAADVGRVDIRAGTEVQSAVEGGAICFFLGAAIVACLAAGQINLAVRGLGVAARAGCFDD